VNAAHLTVIVVMGCGACSAPQTESATGTIRPQLAFRISGETGLAAARDLTVDQAGNAFVFDYDDYVIRKFDPNGALLASFGGTGSDSGLFQHLMAIRAAADSLVALDAGSVTVFDLSGELRSRRSLADTIICDFPRISPDGRWVCEQFVEETAEQVLTYRRPDGTERARLAGFPLSELYPGVEPGEMFFVSRTQGRTYLYDFLPDGRLVWLSSDRLRIHEEGHEGVLFEADATPVPFPEDEIAALRVKQADLGPPLFMNVPTHYQVVQQFTVDGAGDIWLLVMSLERTGLLRVSPTGEERGFYAVEAEFDLLSARLIAAHGDLYFMLPGREGTSVYRAALP